MSFFKLKRKNPKNDAIKGLEGVGTNEVNLDGFCPLVCKIPVGLCGDRIFDLTFSSEENYCASYMITGDKSSAKALIDAIIINGSLKYTPGELSFRLYDAESGGALTPYESARLPHVARIGSCLNESEAVQELSRLNSVIKKREELFKDLATNCGKEIRNIYEYNKNARCWENGDYKQKKRIIAVLNGIRKILNSPLIDKTYASQLCSLVGDIAKKGSAVGVHLVLTGAGFTDSELDSMLKSKYVEKIRGRIALTQEKSEAKRLGFGKHFDKRINDVAKLEKGQALISTDGAEASLVDLSVFTPIEEYIERISESTIFIDEKTEKLSKQ